VFRFVQLQISTNYTVIVYCGDDGGYEPVGSSVTFTTPIPAPVMSVGTVTSTTVALTWAVDAYAQWHRVEYSETTKSKRSGVTLVAAMQSGSGMTVTGLSPGSLYAIHVYSGSGSSSSSYEPHGTVIDIQTAAGPAGSDSKELSTGNQFFSFLFFRILVSPILESFLLLLLRCHCWDCGGPSCFGVCCHYCWLLFDSPEVENKGAINPPGNGWIFSLFPVVGAFFIYFIVEFRSQVALARR